MPTFGRVPKSGCVPLGYSLDHIGPLARSTRDCAAMLAIIAGHHPSDESCVDRPVDDYVGGLTGDLTGMRIGVDHTNHFPEESDPALRGCFDAAVATLADLGADIVEVTLPLYHEVNTAQWVMMAAEALAYHHNDLSTRWDDYYALSRATICRGALSSGSDYVQAARVRRVTQEKLAQTFETVDLVAGPTLAIGALSSEDMLGRRLGTFMKMLFTGYWDAVGNPALALPMGFTEDGLPLSLQLGARPFEEAVALKAGDAYQTRTDWHLRLPALLTESIAAAS
jgi:aspartyl-tRNA(Asn)/glutamyl-tRNA(Gln) amidotransferase subunit A